MKLYFKIFLLSLVLIILSFLPKPISAQKNQSEVTILFTHDMHDRFYPYKVKSNGEIKELGGFSRIYTAILKERELDEDLLLLDAGDFSMGTLFQTIFETHSPTLRTMGKLGYDATTLGNHEFDFRPEGLANSLDSAKSSNERVPEIIASNTFFPYDKDGGLTPSLSKLKSAMDDYGVKEYLVIEKGDLKIGILGLMGEDADSNAPMAEVEFKDIVDSSKRIVDTLKNKENVDLIIAISHTGTSIKGSKSEDEILAKKVPEIDVIISGHSHTKLNNPIIVDKTIIGSAGRYGENLGKIKIVKDDDGWKLVDYSLIEINESYIANEEISLYIEDFKEDIQNEYLDRFNMTFDQVLAYSPFNFTPSQMVGKEHREDSLGNLISDSYIYSVKKAEGENYRNIDAAIVPSGVIRDSFTKGNITVSDVFNVSSLGIGADRVSGYPLIDVYLTGKELRTVAEVDASIQPLMSAAQLYTSGLNYSFNPNRMIFNKVTDVYLVDENEGRIEIVDDELYRVVAGLYSAQMLSVVGDKSFNLLSIVPKNEDGTPIEDYESRIIYEDGHEVKEWLALAQYLDSFPAEKGIAQLPVYYNQLQGRKTIDNSKNIFDRVKNPNKISIAIYSIIIVLISGITTLIVFLLRRKKKRKSKDKSRI